MPHNRYYIDAALEENGIIELSNEESHHLIRVLRAKLGDEVELINGRNQLATAHVQALHKNTALLQITHIAHRSSTPPLILAQAFPRMNHLEWIIEKGTELGATAFWLFPGNLSEKDTLTETQIKRLKNLAISAMKQCGRLDLPEIVFKPPLSKWPYLSGTLLFGDTHENAPYLWDVPLKQTPFPLILFIGPEKGFEAKEHQCLRTHFRATGVRLHSNILRAETAPLVGLALLRRFLTN